VPTQWILALPVAARPYRHQKVNAGTAALRYPFALIALAPQLATV